MTKEREALKLSLEALEDRSSLMKWQEARDAVKEALAQPEQEPVVGTKTWFEDGKVVTQNLTAKDIYKEPEQREPVAYSGNGTAGRENMTAPTGFFFQMPKREWVGLTDEETQTCWDKAVNTIAPQYSIVRAIEAKLKEKNT